MHASRPLAVCRYIILILIGLCVGLFSAQTSRAQAAHVFVLPVQGIIGPASSEFVSRGLDAAVEQKADLIVIELDTPGGLDPAMRAIVQRILASPIPVATYVSPGGARAASAGTFILYASHIAAMTPASNLGAATPVSIGLGARQDAPAPDSADKDANDSGNSDDPSSGGRDSQSQNSSSIMAGKVTNDAAAYIRSLAQLRNRDAAFAEQAVRGAASLSAHEALERGVIEYIAADLNALLIQLDGLEVRMSDTVTVQLHTAGATVTTTEPGWRTKLLSILTNPQLAVILMMIGVYGLFFELTSPGFALPGVAGLICLVLGLYAFHLLPINWAGVALLLAGASLMVAEVFLPSFGVLGVGGIVAFVLGGLFLTDTGIPGFDLTLPFLIGLGVASASLLLLAGTLATRAAKRKVVTGTEAMLGLRGVVLSTEDDVQYAELRGERWRITSDNVLACGDCVEVTALNGLTLQVVKVAERAIDTISTKG